MTYETVLVRGCMGKPYISVLVLERNKLKYVANCESIERLEAGLTQPVGVAPDDVFRYDEVAYSRICELWNKKRTLTHEEWRRCMTESTGAERISVEV